MKIKPRVATIAVLAVFSVVVCAAALRAPKAEVPVSETDTPEAAEYYLRDCDGFIAVYRGASSTPIDITEIETATLNDTDLLMLQKGIPAGSRNELLLLLEDLGS